MSADWYYSSKGKKVGPVSESEIRSLATSGRLSATNGTTSHPLLFVDGPDHVKARIRSDLQFRILGPHWHAATAKTIDRDVN